MKSYILYIDDKRFQAYAVITHDGIPTPGMIEIGDAVDLRFPEVWRQAQEYYNNDKSF